MIQVKKRSISAFAAAGLSLAVLASGCSGNNAGPGSEATPGNSSPDKNAKKPVITVSMYDRGNVPAEFGTPEKNIWSEWINENSPVQVKFVPIPRNESVQKLNVLFASGEAPDVIFEFDANFRNQLYNQKQLMPLDDLIEKHSTVYKKLISEFPELKKAGTKSDGKLYEFGKLKFSHSFNGLFIRNDWLKKLNLKVPETVDELFAVAKAFAEQDPDGNGKKDTYGIHLSGANLIPVFFGSRSLYVKDGALFKDQTLAREKAALEFQKRLYDAGIVDKDFLTDKNGEKATQDWITGKLGIFAGRTIDLDSYKKFYEALKKNDPQAEVIPIAAPRSEFGQFTLLLNNPVQMTVAVNANAKDPVAVMKFIDFMAAKSTGMTFAFGKEGEHWTTGPNGCPVQKDPEKFKKELSWAADYLMVTSTNQFGPCFLPENLLNSSNPREKEFIDIIRANNKINLDTVKNYPDITHSEHMPSLPQNLQVTKSNLDKTYSDLISKAIVSGASYTAAQAIEDYKKAYQSTGGQQLDDFYINWYKENKTKAFLAEDLFKIRIDK